MVQKADLEIAFQGSDDNERMRTLMHKYRDLPMDLADASLVRLAEERRVREIFTLDERDFQIYRIHGRQRFRIWPKRAS
jgi:predicted nucleic acid-binding protein